MLPDYGLSDKNAEEFLKDAREFYYNLALSGNKYTLGLITEFASKDRILFGSDFLYAPTPTIETHTRLLDAYGLNEKQACKIAQDNALRLFPRLKSLYSHEKLSFA